MIEELVDRSRERRDALSTICAGLTTAGAFSLYSKSAKVVQCPECSDANHSLDRLPLSTAARMTRWGLLAGLSYGFAQDGVAWLQRKSLPATATRS